MFGFIARSRIIRADLRPLRPIFFVYDLFGLLMLFLCWEGWSGLEPFRRQQPVVSVDLVQVAFIGFIGFYGLRLAMFIAMARGLRMPQVMEWLVTIIPATIAVLCIFLSGPIERTYAAAQGYGYCGRVEDAGTRSSLYVFALRSAACPPKEAGQ